jgi:hypothetical protein
MVVFDELSLLISRVLGDHAIPAKGDPLRQLIEPFTFVGGRLNRTAQLSITKLTEQENCPHDPPQFAKTEVKLVFCVSCC